MYHFGTHRFPSDSLIIFLETYSRFQVRAIDRNRPWFSDVAADLKLDVEKFFGNVYVC
jgi:hypothetical protein